jgi:hypothetical protein
MALQPLCCWLGRRREIRQNKRFTSTSASRTQTCQWHLGVTVCISIDVDLSHLPGRNSTVAVVRCRYHCTYAQGPRSCDPVHSLITHTPEMGTSEEN